MGNCSWDVVSFVEGFSAEGGVQRDLDASGLVAFVRAAAQTAPVVPEVLRRPDPRIATIDDRPCRSTCTPLGPGRSTTSATSCGRGALAELWSAIAAPAAESQVQSYTLYEPASACGCAP